MKKVKAMDKVANSIFQKQIELLYERYEKSQEKAIFTFEEYARDIANTRNNFFGKVVKSVMEQYDNQTEIVGFKEYCKYLQAISNQRIKE